MHRVILGVEDLYYERVDEFELLVCEDYDVASEFAAKYPMDAIDRYVKVVDDNDMVKGYKKNYNKQQTDIVKPRSIGFA